MCDKAALQHTSLDAAERGLPVITDEVELTSGRTTISAQNLPVLPLPGTRGQGGCIQRQQLFVHFGTVSYLYYYQTQTDSRNIKTGFSAVLSHATPSLA